MQEEYQPQTKKTKMNKMECDETQTNSNEQPMLDDNISVAEEDDSIVEEDESVADKDDMDNDDDDDQSEYNYSDYSDNDDGENGMMSEGEDSSGNGGDYDSGEEGDSFRMRSGKMSSVRNLTYTRGGVTRQISVTNNIKMVGKEQIIPLMKSRIKDTCNLMSLPPEAVQPLLRRHKWVNERLNDEYFKDEEQETRKAGVYHRCLMAAIEQEPTCNIATTTPKKDHFCTICLEDFTKSEMLAMPCGHEFCKGCWAQQIKTKIGDGPSCIQSTCPADKCNEIVTEVEVQLVAPDLLPKYQNYQLRNFVELSEKSRWCPGPGCDRIAAIMAANGTLCDAESITASCDKCKTCFCLKCGSEPHPPLECHTLDNWKEKCRNESETANWILTNTKPCPKCRTRIEKNQGCNHMTCQVCKHEFCWICNGDWKDHGSNTGGYYNCNKFENNEDVEDQSDVAKAKRELDRYLHYYKRYHAHSEAQRFAQRQLKETGARMMLLQEHNDNATWSDVEFLKTANEQLVECRRVLKFTYVFAYYMTTPVVNNTKTDSQTDNTLSDEDRKELQKQRFEYHQEMLEKFTENLSEMAEKPLREINRTEVVNQTRVMGQYIKKILQYVDDGLED